jgi:hypothetical protein
VTTYYVNEAAFTLPEGFVDQTAHSVHMRLPGGLDLRLLVARFPLRPGTSLGATVAEAVKRHAARVAHHAVLDRREATVAGRPAILLQARWREQGVPFFERQAHIAVTGTRGMLLALTGPRDAEAAGDERFAHILDTLTLRDPD